MFVICSLENSERERYKNYGGGAKESIRIVNFRAAAVCWPRTYVHICFCFHMTLENNLLPSNL